MFDFEKRRQKLRKLMRKNKISAMLVTNEVNVTYLTGFSGDSSYLLMTPDTEIVLSDARYTVQLEEECPDLEVVIRGPGVRMLDILEQAVRQAKPTHIALESNAVTLQLYEAFRERLPEMDWPLTSGLVEELREIKDKQEIKQIREAVDLAQRSFAIVRNALRPNRTELEVAHELEHQIRLFGGTFCSFPPIVAVGPRAALPHARPQHYRIEESPFVLIDWGARGAQYVSDLTRVLVTGTIPPKLERIYEVVLKAQLAAIAKIKPGVSGKEVDAAARTVIAKSGYGKYFGHGLGHGIGLQVHEGPRVAMDTDVTLRPGMVITVEPGIYLPGWGGVRLEDDILVTRNGHEVLSSVPKAFADSIVA